MVAVLSSSDAGYRAGAGSVTVVLVCCMLVLSAGSLAGLALRRSRPPAAVPWAPAGAGALGAIGSAWLGGVSPWVGGVLTGLFVVVAAFIVPGTAVVGKRFVRVAAGGLGVASSWVAAGGRPLDALALAAATAVLAVAIGARRFLPWAIGLAVLLAGGAAWAAGVRPDTSVLTTPRGILVAAELVLLVTTPAAARRRRGETVAGAWVLRDGASSDAPGRRRPGRVPAVLVAVTLVAGTAVVAAPVTGLAGAPMLRVVRVGDAPVAVYVVPQRPGWNLVRVGAAGLTVRGGTGRALAATTREGASSWWATVELPAGRSTLVLSDGTATATLPVDAGSARAGRTGGTGITSAGGIGDTLLGADGPECADVALGRTLADARSRPRGCPSDALDPLDAGTLRATVRYVAGRGVPAISLISDRSARGMAADAVVRRAAADAGLRVERPGPSARRPLFVTTGWRPAAAVVQAVTVGELAVEGTYLAPWLLNGVLLTPPAAQLLALRFDVRDPQAVRYLETLRAGFPGAAPTAAGFGGWSSVPAAGPPRLFAASQVLTPGGHEHAHDRHWVDSGTVTAVTGPLPTPAT